MSCNMDDSINADPFEVLRVAYTASDAEIITARDAALRAAKRSQEEILLAYNRVRTQRLRDEFCFGDIRSILYRPRAQNVELDTAALVNELAFLSAWELGIFSGQ